MLTTGYVQNSRPGCKYIRPLLDSDGNTARKHVSMSWRQYIYQSTSKKDKVIILANRETHITPRTTQTYKRKQKQQFLTKL